MDKYCFPAIAVKNKQTNKKTGRAKSWQIQKLIYNSLYDTSTDTTTLLKIFLLKGTLYKQLSGKKTKADSLLSTSLQLPVSQMRT